MSRIRWSAAAIGFVLAWLAYGFGHMVMLPLVSSIPSGRPVVYTVAFALTTLLRLGLGAAIALLALRGGGTEVAPVLTAVVGVGAHSLVNSAWLYTIGPADLAGLGAIGMALYDLVAWSATAALGAWLVARSRRAFARP